MMAIWQEIVNFWNWLTSPSVIPWVGMAAAVLAALSVDPKGWLKAPGQGLRRAGQVALLWLVLVWLFPWTSCSKTNGTGGSSGSGDGGELPPPTPPQPDGRTPTDLLQTLEQADLVIRFVPLPNDPATAQEFACDLHYKDEAKGSQAISIRATKMQDFDRQLEQHLRKVPLPRKTPKVVVFQSPSPGENVLRRIREKITASLPNPTVEESQPPEADAKK
ncbi:hypothetical protein [Thermogemmata fonticola]|uniref:Uncharacterized protein n=1 Tax=Thermogemmata fonticola TaxID=2755323 RepID=A0A7V9AC56_9BACT|nr:hypothetical protein [Thermogemmata fonticola]MBA2226659.1 hypothetical protein [Thermogemmata fonticola]